ncbi:MAG TPA: histidine kinase dimerization/phospho-acceptor domain-containing protein [candidate division Zixibacteria bacterium]|nr:histidine kinase dimerization/phospho-acceptor domain-containing protein [candidate division Zixibacteria bacterium]
MDRLLEQVTNIPTTVGDELLSRFEIGQFVVDRDRYIVHTNETAARLLGIDEQAPGIDYSLERIDNVFDSDVQEHFNEVLNGDRPFCLSEVHCTNRRGQFCELDFCCQAFGYNDDRRIVALVRQTRKLENQAAYAELQDELQILAEVATALSSTHDLDHILMAILTGATASQGLGFNRAFLFLYDEKQRLLQGHLAVGPTSAEEAGRIWHDMDSNRLTLSDLLTASIHDEVGVEGGITGLIKDYSIDFNQPSDIENACHLGQWFILDPNDPVDEITQSLILRLGSRELALVPMVSKGNLQGLLVADNLFTGRTITDEDVRLLQVLSNQAAVAMERAELYEIQLQRAQEMERINRRLAETQDQIIQFEKMSVIGELTSAIAHELRNPLTIVGGFANLLLKSDLADHHREYLNIIAGEVRRAETVLAHVLDFSKASRARNEVVDFSALIERSYRTLAGRCRGAFDDINLELQPGIEVFGNSDQLAHAVYQLLKLVAEELIPPGDAVVHTEIVDGQACMTIDVHTPEENRDKMHKLLTQIFSQKGASQRLTVMVAGETIRYHGGTYGLQTNLQSLPSLYVKIPIHRRKNDSEENPGS